MVVSQLEEPRGCRAERGTLSMVRFPDHKVLLLDRIIDATEGVSYVLQRIIHLLYQLVLVSSLHVPALGSPRYDTYAMRPGHPTSYVH